MNPKLHTALRIVFALFLIVSGAKHLYTVYWGDPTIMATGQLEQGIAVCTHDEFTADIPANQVSEVRADAHGASAGDGQHLGVGGPAHGVAHDRGDIG